MDSLSIETLSQPLFPGCAVLRLQGIIYASTLVQVEKAVKNALEDKKKNLVLDLAGTNYVSSGGWSAILSAAKKVRDLGGDLFLSGMKAEVYDAFELLEYDKVIRLFTTPEKAFREGLPQARPA